MSEVESKRCTRCEQVLPLTDFGNRARFPDGHLNQCKACVREFRQNRVPVLSFDGMKRCSKCKEDKPYSEFNKANSSSDGYRTQCKTCSSISSGFTPRPKPEPVAEGYMRCSKCNGVLPATVEFFKKSKKANIGISRICKRCATDYTKQWFNQRMLLDPEYTAKRYANNRDKERARSHDWYVKNKDRQLAYSKAWREANKEWVKEFEKRQYETNRHQIIERSRQWRKDNEERYREYNQRWIDEHPEKAAATRKGVDVRRRARKRGLPNTFTPADWLSSLDYWDHKCAVCRRSPDGVLSLAADHWIPLSRPESPGTVPTNIVVLCDGKTGCNTTKHARDPVKWLTEKLGEEAAQKKIAEIQAYFAYVSELQKEE